MGRDFTCIITGCGLLALLLLIPLLIWLLLPDTSTSEPFDCRTRGVWGRAKKAYCCANYGVACPTNSPTLPPPVPDPYNCQDGFNNWQAGWSVGKKAWCCAHHSKGCPNGGGCGTTKPPYDCSAGFWNWQHGWSVAKKAWCCQHERKGCPQGGGCA